MAHAQHVLADHVPVPRGSYASVVIWHDLAFVAGHVGRENGQAIRGRLDGSQDIAHGQEGARASMRACLAALEARLDSLAMVERVLSVRGFLVSTARFEHHTEVLDAASDLVIEVLGERGRHTRAVVGVASLPSGGLAEIEMVVGLVPGATHRWISS